MTQQNFAATADYFAERALRAPAGPARKRFEDTAQLYKEKAEQCGHRRDEPPKTGASSGGIPSRRLRLMELFRAHADR